MFVMYTPCIVFSHLLFVVTLGIGKLQRGRIFISYEGVQCTKLLRRPDRTNTAFAGHKSQRGQLIDNALLVAKSCVYDDTEFILQRENV